MKRALQAAMSVLNDGARLTTPAECGCPRSYQRLMEQSWAQDPQTRPTFGRIIEVLKGLYDEIGGEEMEPMPAVAHSEHKRLLAQEMAEACARGCEGRL